MGIDLSSLGNNEKKNIFKFNQPKFIDNILNFLSFRHFSDKKKEEFYKEFALLINSGIDFKQSLDILIKQQSLKKDKDILLFLKKNIVKGKSLYEAMKSSKMFSTYDYYSVKIGEEINGLEKIFRQLGNYYSRKIKMKRQLISIFSYPVFVIIITNIVLFFMLNNVVPMFASVFKRFGGDLPPITKRIIVLSDNLPKIVGFMVIFIFLLIIIHLIFKNNDKYRFLMSEFFIKTPFLGELIKKIYLTRFSQSLSLLLNAKIPLLESLELTEKMINYYPLESSINGIRKEIMKGGKFSEAISKYSIYNNKITYMVKIGEEINKLDIMFEKLVIQYNEEIEYQTKMIGVILEPIIIILIGLIVGIIMIAMYSPMFNLSKILSQG